MSSRAAIKFIENQSARRTDRFNSASAIITTTNSNSNKNKINDSAKNKNKNESTATMMSKASTTPHGVSSSSPSSLSCLLRTLLRHKEADAARLQAENDRLKQLLVKQQSLLNKLNEDNLVLANSQQQLAVGNFNESNESISRPMSHGDDDEDDEECDYHHQQQQRAENRLPSSPLRHNNNSLKNDTIIGNNFEYTYVLFLYFIIL